jgi:polar amino acid transport system substrate-binding protein
MRTLLRVLCAILVMVLVQPVRASQDDIVVVNVDDANPPFMSGSLNNARGLYPSIIETVFGMMGARVLVQAMPWKRALSSLDQGVAAVGGLYKTSRRSVLYDFSEPLFIERVVVVYNVHHPLVFHSLKDLEGKTVGVITSWSYGDAFDQAHLQGRVHVSASNSDIQNLGKLELGRVDAVLAIDEAARNLIHSGGLGDLAVAPIPLAENPTYLAFNKKLGARRQLDEFNAGLRELKRTRLYQKLIDDAMQPAVCLPPCYGPVH